MIVHAGGSSAELYEDNGVRIYTVHNKDLERLLFDRNLLAVGFRDACLASSRHFIRHFEDEYVPGHAAELVILSKGILYQLSEAVSRETGENLPTNLIATSRVTVSGDSASVEIAYSQFEAPARTLLVGDTVASGATITKSLQTYMETVPLERVYVFSYAGTRVGAQRIARFCRANSVDCTFLFGLGIFGLGDNGFDLSFLHPDTTSRESYKDRAHRQFAGRAVSAVGWDFGSQAMTPNKYRHLCWVEAEVWGLQGAECFAVAVEPSDFRELAREQPAYAGRLPGGMAGRRLR